MGRPRLFRRSTHSVCALVLGAIACELPIELKDGTTSSDEIMGVYEGTADLRTGHNVLMNRSAFFLVGPAGTGRDFSANCHVSETNTNRVNYRFDGRPGSALSGSSRHVRSGITMQSTVNVRKTGGVLTGSCRLERLLNDGTWSTLYEVINISVTPR